MTYMQLLWICYRFVWICYGVAWICYRLLHITLVVWFRYQIVQFYISGVWMRVWFFCKFVRAPHELVCICMDLQRIYLLFACCCAATGPEEVVEGDWKQGGFHGRSHAGLEQRWTVLAQYKSPEGEKDIQCSHWALCNRSQAKAAALGGLNLLLSYCLQ